MRPDLVEVSWDTDKSKWLVKITIGEEVIRRYCSLPKSAGEQDLRKTAEETLRDEGYELDGLTIKIQPMRVA
jgi:hypothetical protein